MTREERGSEPLTLPNDSNTLGCLGWFLLDNIETGVLSSDDTEGANETDGGVAVTEDPPQVDILKLDIETGLLTPEKPESDQDDPVVR